MAAVWGAPWWGVVSSAAAPLLLVSGWTVAALLQPRSFDAVSGTVSALAAVGAADRWVMTLAFALAGACEVITGLALRPAGPPGRLILMVGGAAAVLVAANPEHAGGSLTHAFWAGVAFAALVAWPGAAWRRGPSVPWGLRPAVSASAAAILLGLLAWFLLDLVTGGGHAGLAERVMGVTQAAWPLAVVLSCRWQTHDGPDALPGTGEPRPRSSPHTGSRSAAELDAVPAVRSRYRLTGEADADVGGDGAVLADEYRVEVPAAFPARSGRTATTLPSRNVSSEPGTAPALTARPGAARDPPAH